MEPIGVHTDVKAQERKSKAFRNGTLGALAGAAAAGGIGYHTTKLVKNGVPTDQFVHNVLTELRAESKNLNLKERANLEIRYDAYKEFLNKGKIDFEGAKAFLEKNKLIFSKKFNDFNNGKSEEVLQELNDAIKKYNDNFKEVKELLIGRYDATKKRFNFKSLTSEFDKIAESAMIGTKIPRGAKWGAIGAVGFGILAYIATKVKENKQ